VLGINNDRQIGMHTAEPLVPELVVFRLKLLFKKLEDINHQAVIESGRTDPNRR
jgi:hypothetical protein